MQEVFYKKGEDGTGFAFAFANRLFFSCISPPHFLQQEPRKDVVNTDAVSISPEVTQWLIFSQIGILVLSVVT